MDLLDNSPPSSQRVFAIEARNLRIESRRRVVRICALRDNEPDAAFRAPTIIRGHVFTRHPLR